MSAGICFPVPVQWTDWADRRIHFVRFLVVFTILFAAAYAHASNRDLPNKAGTGPKTAFYTTGMINQERQGDHMKSILDPSFRYTPSVNTDLKKTFARIRRRTQCASNQGRARDRVEIGLNVLPMPKRTAGAIEAAPAIQAAVRESARHNA